MRGSPVKNLLELIPIIDLFEIKMLNRAPVTTKPS